MADLAVGLSKTVVQGAISKVQSAIEEDAKLRRKAQRDLVAITLEFEMMQSFLDVAKEENVANSMVRTWVRHVRELAYDLEDCVEFVVHLDNTPEWWRRLLPSCVAPPLPLDQAVQELEDLKRRVEDVNNCYKRYNNISESKLVMLQQHGSVDSTAFVKAMDAAKIHQGHLTQLLANHSIPVISVWGTCGDHGVPAIIREAYNDKEISHNFTCRAWVKLMHPFNPHEFVRSMSDQFYANECRMEERRGIIGLDVLERSAPTEPGTQVVVDHHKEFARRVNKERYLVVLEDLVTITEWDAIINFFPERKNGSCIIVSTQQPQLATLSVGDPYQVLELNQFQFPVDHSVYAFYKESSQCDDDKDEDTEDKASDLAVEGDRRKGVAVDWLQRNPLVGRMSEMKDLRRYLAAEVEWRSYFYGPKVISVWGIPGVGKSALVKSLLCNIIFNDNWSDQFDNYLWVDVSYPFSLRDFCRSLLLSFHSQYLKAVENCDTDPKGSKNPIVECRKILRYQRCLIIIDDLQSTKQWDMIRRALSTGSSWNSIIIITTEETIAKHCQGKEGELVLNVKGLQADDAFDLFQKTSARHFIPPTLAKNAAAELLSSKCGGLPKIILEVARSLAKNPVGCMETACSSSTKFINDLENNPEFDGLQGLLSWIRNNFRNCPDSVRPCIFYLPIFPRNHFMRRRRLVRRWIAEGYCRDSHEQSAEDNGEKNFSKLLEMYVLQYPPQEILVGDTRMVLCQVNGFMQEFIVSRRMEENFAFELGGNCTLTTQRTGRHLTILANWDRDKIVFNSIDFSRLRSLTVFGKWESFFISKSMKLLRVLDLEDASDVNEADLEKMVKLLGRLKFLSLRGCRSIFNLPSSIGDLRQLQTMDVRDTSIVTLPENIIKLQKLQYIRAGRGTREKAIGGANLAASAPPVSSIWLPKFCKRRQLVGVVVPEGIGKLTALHTFGVVNLTASGSKAVLEELNELTQLRKLGVSGVNRKNSKDFVSAISGNVHLETLSVQLNKDNENCLDDVSFPFENLRSLTLHGLHDKLPKWSHDWSTSGPIDQLSKLVKLDLEMATIMQDDIAFLGQLRQLCILRVKQLKGGDLHFRVLTDEKEADGEEAVRKEVARVEVDSYQKIKVLEIACGCSSGNLHVTFGSEAMKKLEQLKFDCSSGSLCYELTGQDHLSELKLVVLKGTKDATTDEALKRALETHFLNHRNKPPVKLE